MCHPVISGNRNIIAARVKGRHVALWARDVPQTRSSEGGREIYPWLPDGYSRILDRNCVALRAWKTMAPLRYAANFDPLLSLEF